MSWFSSFADKVQITLPTKSSDIFNALTLNTAEMTAEREQFEIEARRKEAIADSLSALLLWETNDEERVILVEECKEAILSLSTRKETFLGTSVDESSATNDSSNITTDHASELLRKELSSRITALGKSNGNMPPLLENFDLDAHIGLVRRMFDADPNLVEMHGNLSGERTLEER